MQLMQLSHAVVQCQKRFGNVFEGINRAPPSHSLQLPPNFRMVYNNMDYSAMDSPYVCDLCDISFSRDDNLKRHMESKHGRDTKQGHTCGECGKGFSRKDALRRHQLTCQAIRFKCPRCHRIFKDIVSLTRHMGLCPVPTCRTCQEQFVELGQLREHQKSHRKRKTTSDPLAPKLKKRKRDGWFHCRVCLDSFATREELFHHRLDHMDDDRAYRPMEPHFDFEDEKLNALLRDNAELIFSHHRFTPVSADFNFPLTLSLTRDGWLNDIYQTLDLVANISNDESFKFNLSMGFILVNRESGDYRFFVPHANNAFFKTPQRIERPACWRELYSQLDEEALKTYVTHHRENTKWLPMMITNVVVHLYYLGVPMGSGLLPDYVTNHGSIVGLDKDKHNRTPYQDKHCGVRCLAFHLNYKQTGNGFRGLEERREQLSMRWNRVVNLSEVPLFEETFDINVDIYTLCSDGAVIPRYLSEEKYQDKMVLNLHDTHLSYVKNVPAYLKKYRCDSCGRNFVQLSDFNRHQGSCANATEYEFAGGFHKMSLSIFDRLEEFDIVVPEENRLYPWFIVYDFEAILAPITEEQPTPRLKWLRKHEPISVSVASNVPGFEEAKCFVNPDPKELIESMMTYMGSIADSACDSAESKWSSEIEDLEDLIEKYELKLGKEPKRKKRRKESSKIGHDKLKVKDDELKGLTDEERKSLTSQWESTCEKLTRLLGSLYHYCRQIPVLGFNSAKYDLNLVKSHLIPWLRRDLDPNKDDADDTCDVSVIKKGSTYTQIGARRFKFLDISNYLAGGVSYSGFLQAYKIPEAKSYFPYEWFDHPAKLDFPCLPPYQTFYSELKQRNVLEVRDKKDNDDDGDDQDQNDKVLGARRYRELQDIWRRRGMTTFRDFLEYYNNLDVGPFVQAVEKMQQFYFNHHIDLFKVAVSVPGIARRWLFQTAHEAKTSFGLIQPRDDDLYYIIKQNIVGGPSIIFTRDAEVGRTFVRNDPAHPCANIVGYDANALYLDCIDKAMPCGGYVRRYAPDFKPDSRLSCEDMFHWMNYLMETESVHILHKRNHISEVRVGPYLVDGYDPNTRTVYEFHGCYFHGCSHCKKDQDDLGKERKMHTDTKEKYLRNKGYNLRIIWEHEFKSKQRSDPKLKEFVRQRQPPFYRKHRWITKESTILDAVSDDSFFGFLEVDIHVPDHLYDYFEEMPPLFCNTEVKFEDMGAFMQQYVRDHHMSDKPRRLLLSGMKAEKLMLSSPYLKWLLQKGLRVTKLHQVVEYTPQRCFRQFVRDVSDARRAGDVDNAQKIIADTMKLIGNSGYGSLIMDKEKHQDTLYAEGWGAAQLNINDPRFKKCAAITDNLFEMEMAKTKIRFDLPIQLGYHILQLAKLRMLQFRYDCLQEYCDVKDFEYLEMDTDSAYLSLAAKQLEDIVKPNKKQELHHEKMGQCRDFEYTSEDGFFPRECCKKHKAYDKRTPGLFKVEAEGKAMIALCSKTYILKKHDDKVKFSSKGLNKAVLKEPFPSYRHVLQTGQTKSSTNQGFRTRDNTVYTYQQTKGGLSYFYCKREVLPDGIHTRPLTITLSPWPPREVEVVDQNHPWSLEKEHEFCVEGKMYEATLADVCLAKPNALESVILQLPCHTPKGKVIVPLSPSLKKKHTKWKHDTYWTTGLSPKSSLLRLCTPGQNKLGEMLERVMLTRMVKQIHLRDHDYL